MLDHLPAEFHGAPLLRRGRTTSDNARPGQITDRRIMILHEQTPDDGPHIARSGLGLTAQLHQTQIFFLLQNFQGRGNKIRRDDHFAENFRDSAGQWFGHGAIGDDNPAEWRLTIRSEGFLPSGSQILIAPYPAGIGVFENGHRRVGEFGDEIHRRGDIEDVVVGKFFAVQLLEVIGKIPVELGLLVRILTITQTRRQRVRETE